MANNEPNEVSTDKVLTSTATESTGEVLLHQESGGNGEHVHSPLGVVEPRTVLEESDDKFTPRSLGGEAQQEGEPRILKKMGKDLETTEGKEVSATRSLGDTYKQEVFYTPPRSRSTGDNIKGFLDELFERRGLVRGTVPLYDSKEQEDRHDASRQVVKKVFGPKIDEHTLKVYGVEHCEWLEELWSMDRPKYTQEEIEIVRDEIRNKAIAEEVFVVTPDGTIRPIDRLHLEVDYIPPVMSYIKDGKFQDILFLTHFIDVIKH